MRPSRRCTAARTRTKHPMIRNRQEEQSVVANNWYINADAQSAANIIRKALRPRDDDRRLSSNRDKGTRNKKVSINSSSPRSINLERVSRTLLTAPHRIKLWSANRTKNH